MSLREHTLRGWPLPCSCLSVTGLSVQPGCRAAAPCVVPRRVRRTRCQSRSVAVETLAGTVVHCGRASPSVHAVSVRECPACHDACVGHLPGRVSAAHHLTARPRPLGHRDQRISVSPTLPTATAPAMQLQARPRAIPPPAMRPSSRRRQREPAQEPPAWHRLPTGSLALHVHTQCPAQPMAPPTTTRPPTLGDHLPHRPSTATWDAVPHPTPTSHRSGPCPHQG